MQIEVLLLIIEDTVQNRYAVPEEECVLYVFQRGRQGSVKRHGKPMRATRLIALCFLGIILTGTLLLMLPASSRSGRPCAFLPALFTATSATCVTGLTPFDTWSQWSGFGQLVLLCLIEVGGLGFMSAATLVIFLFRRKVGLRQRMIIAQALSLNEMDGVVRLQRMVIFGSLAFQAAGALILACRFWPQYGLAKALQWGIFHSVSAFCNAGFDIFGEIAPGTSVQLFRNDPVVLLTLGSLIAVGGLGFLVWEDVARKRRWRKLSVYSRLVLLATGSLILSGWILICILEWNNPRTLGNLSLGGKLLGGLFQSLTLRTAGFDGLNQAGLTEGGKAVSMMLMMVGGSSGSTAGGLKTVTFLVLLLFIGTRTRGRSTVTVYRHTIPEEQVMNAMTISLVMIALAMFGGIFVSATSPVNFTDALFESVSALATVGLTAGATTLLSVPAKILIIVFMYFGRVGVLTISLGFLMGDQAVERFRYAETSLLIG